MVDWINKFERKHGDDFVVVPYTSHGRLVSWIRTCFRVSNRRYFWCTVIAVSILFVSQSGWLMTVFLGAPLFMLPAALKQQLKLDRLEGEFSTYLYNLRNDSPADKLLASTLGKITIEKSDELIFLGYVAIAIWIIIFARLFLCAKTQLILRKEGLALAWQLPFKLASGPVISWTELKSVSYKTAGRDSSPEGLIEFIYAKPRWQYKLAQPAKAVSVNKLSLDLRNLDNLEQRHMLGKAIERWAPPNTVQPDVMEILSATQSQTYTELWLQALTAPSSRKSLEPLAGGKKLQDGKYQIHSQLAVGGQGTAYLAQSAEPIAPFPVPKLSNNYGIFVPHKPDVTSSSSSSHASQNSDRLSIDRSIDEGDHVLQIDSANIVIKEYVLPLYVDSNSRKNALRKFLDEADLLKRLDHKRVVKLSDCFVEDHRGYLVLERIYGDSLHQIVLRNGAFTEGRVLELLEQMLDVLSYLHSRVPPVVHRDFAPDNLILGQDGILKLVDFNVAQQNENSVVGTIVGKQSYVPPEQLRGMATPASDIYALGATLFFLLTGQNPEPISVSHPIDLVPHLSKEIDQLVAQCTRLSEADRFQSVDEIRTAINQNLKWHEQSL